MPTLKTASETIGGSVVYSVDGGKAEREKYFSRIVFPGKSASHLDVAFKARMRLPGHDMVAAIDVSPVWSDDTKVLMNFDADTSKLSEADLPARAALVNQLVTDAMISFELEHALDATQ